MDVFLLYLWTRLDALQTVAFGAALCLAMAIFAILMSEGDVLESDGGKKWVKRFVIVGFVGIFAVVIIPSKKDAALMLAGYSVIEIARSETAGRLASKSVQLIEQTLDSYLKKPEGK